MVAPQIAMCLGANEAAGVASVEKATTDNPIVTAFALLI